MSEQMGLRFRDPSIDLYRGIAIYGMVIANFLMGVDWIPPFLKHSPDSGLTIIDLIAPMFVFAMGVSLGPSMNRRAEKEGIRKASGHMLRRSLSFIGIGALLDAARELVIAPNAGLGWGILQALGFSSLILMLVVRLARWKRILIGYAMLFLYWFGSHLGYVVRHLLATSWRVIWGDRLGFDAYSHGDRR